MKRHTGGFHANSHFACITGFTLFALAAALLLKQVTASSYSIIASCALLIITIILEWCLAPMENPSDPRSEQEYMQAKKKCFSTVLLVAFAVFSSQCVTFLMQYTLAGATGAFCAAFTLIIPQKGGEKDDTED